MGDPRGFMKVRERKNYACRPVEERIKDWQDVHSESGVQSWTVQQAARCMDCGTPFCMTGCPLGNVIPEFNDLIRMEQWEDAYNRLSTTNNFPEVTGRICPALCESACVLGIHQPATTICNDEQVCKAASGSAFHGSDCCDCRFRTCRTCLCAAAYSRRTYSCRIRKRRRNRRSYALWNSQLQT